MTDTLWRPLDRTAPIPVRYAVGEPPDPYLDGTPKGFIYGLPKRTTFALERQGTRWAVMACDRGRRDRLATYRREAEAEADRVLRETNLRDYDPLALAGPTVTRTDVPWFGVVQVSGDRIRVVTLDQVKT